MATADIRFARTAATVGDQIQVSSSGVQSGDVLILIHTADAGPLDQMLPTSGSGTWSALGSSPDELGGNGGVKAWRRSAGSSEPSFYRFTQSPDPAVAAASTLLLICVKDASANGVSCDFFATSSGSPMYVVQTPQSAPTGASALDIRIGASVHAESSFFSDGVEWQAPGGFTLIASAQQSAVTSAAAIRQIVSSSPIGGKDFTLSFSGDGVYEWHGFTITVPSSDISTPTPPEFPSFAPGRGTSRYRYTVHDFLTGEYLTDMVPSQVSFDRRIGEPGTFSATLPVPNERRATKIQEWLPREASDLTSGPGRVVVHVWRAGVLWGIYWIHGARISKSRRSGISIEVRGSTLDAYLLHTIVPVNLSYDGDQIENSRLLLAHLMTDPTAGIGLDLEAGTSGVNRTLTVGGLDGKSYGDALQSFAREYGGYEWVIDPVVTGGNVVRKWIWGYPKLVGTATHVFTEGPHGGDITEWGEEIDALRGATRVRVRGGTPQPTDATEGSVPEKSAWTSATAHLAAGWPRLDSQVDHPSQSIDTSQLNDYASRWIATFPGAVRVYSASATLGATTSISPSSLGDQVRRIQTNAWYRRRAAAAGFDQSQRLIGFGVTPVSRTTGREEVQLILEEASL